MGISKSPEENRERVEAYIERIRHDRHIPRYPIEEKGHYRLVGGVYGDGDSSRRKENTIVVRGRFIDVIAWAVEQDEFYADWCSSEEPENVNNCNHGHIEKVELKELPRDATLDSFVEQMRKKK